MKLYYAPGACSLSADIAVREAGLPVDFIKVDLRSHTTESGEEYSAINPKGYVPALQLDSGELVTEATVVLAYIADQKPELNLIPPPGTMERYRVEEWLVFVATELHKSFGPYYNPASTQEQKDAAQSKIMKRLVYVNTVLDGKEYLTGSSFTVADAYCYAIVRWTKQFNIDITTVPNVVAYLDRITARPEYSSGVSL